MLTDAARARMSTVDTPGRPYDLGLGVRPRNDVGPRVLHFGGGMGYWHVLRLDPHRGAGSCVISNTGRRWDVTAVADEAIDRLL